MKESNYAKLSVCNFGMALALTWGLSLFLVSLLNMWFNIGGEFIEVAQSLYSGYNNSFWGACIGFIWGFVDGFVGGALIAFFYNMCRCCCPCPSCKVSRKGKSRSKS